MAPYQLGAPRSDGETFFCLHLYSIWQEDVAKIFKVPRASRNVKQIIKFELRGLGPPGLTCTPATVYFYDKTIMYIENLRVDYYSLLKCCMRQCTLLSPTWAKSQNLTSKCKILSVFGLSL